MKSSDVCILFHSRKSLGYLFPTPSFFFFPSPEEATSHLVRIAEITLPGAVPLSVGKPLEAAAVILDLNLFQ